MDHNLLYAIHGWWFWKYSPLHSPPSVVTSAMKIFRPHNKSKSLRCRLNNAGCTFSVCLSVHQFSVTLNFRVIDGFLGSPIDEYEKRRKWRRGIRKSRPAGSIKGTVFLFKPRRREQMIRLLDKEEILHAELFLGHNNSSSSSGWRMRETGNGLVAIARESLLITCNYCEFRFLPNFWIFSSRWGSWPFLSFCTSVPWWWGGWTRPRYHK